MLLFSLVDKVFKFLYNISCKGEFYMKINIYNTPFLIRVTPFLFNSFVPQIFKKIARSLQDKNTSITFSKNECIYNNPDKGFVIRFNMLENRSALTCNVTTPSDQYKFLVSLSEFTTAIEQQHLTEGKWLTERFITEKYPITDQTLYDTTETIRQFDEIPFVEKLKPYLNNVLAPSIISEINKHNQNEDAVIEISDTSYRCSIKTEETVTERFELNFTKDKLNCETITASKQNQDIVHITPGFTRITHRETVGSSWFTGAEPATTEHISMFDNRNNEFYRLYRLYDQQDQILYEDDISFIDHEKGIIVRTKKASGEVTHYVGELSFKEKLKRNIFGHQYMLYPTKAMTEDLYEQFRQFLEQKKYTKH